MLIQFALVIPIAIFMIGGVFDWGKFLYTYSTVSLAVTRTARCAALSYNLTDATYPSSCSADYDQFLRNAALGVDTTGFTTSPFTTFDAAGCNPGAKTSVSYTYRFTFLPYSIPVTESACFTRIQ